MTTKKFNEELIAEELKQDTAQFSEELTDEQLDAIAGAGPTGSFKKLFEKIARLFS